MLARLLDAGYEVLLAMVGEDRRYDCVLDLGERFARVQIKTARLTPDRGALVAATASCQGYSGRRVGYRGQVELFAIYSPELDSVYLVPVEECPGAEVRLRLAPTRNGQTRGVRLAVDYELARRDDYERPSASRTATSAAL